MPAYKIWNVSRSLKKTVVAKSLEELKRKGCEKLGISGNVTVVTEEDGTEIDDDEVLEEFSKAILIFLKEDEEWVESGSAEEPAGTSTLSKPQKVNQGKDETEVTKPAKTKLDTTEKQTSDEQDGAATGIGQGMQRESRTNEATNLPHVMISYNWGAQERMLKLRDELKQIGYKVWMDVDKMAGNMDDRMAEAVEQAAVILICSSKNYQESISCKKEAQYGKCLEKPIIRLKYDDHNPSGWLGLLIRPLLYYDVSTNEKMMENLPKLKEEIIKYMYPQQSPDQDIAGPQTTSSVASITIVDSLRRQLKQYYWNKLCKRQVYPWKTGQPIDLDTIYVPVNIDVEIPGARAFKDHLTSYQEIFSDEQESTRFVLVGSPGQGKSTFSAKLAFDWSQSTESSPLKHIQLLFVIQLGLIDHETNIEDAIRSQLLSSDIDAATLGKVIRDLGKSVVLILDGLDEAPPDLFKHKSIGNILKIIRYEYLRDCRVLVATRPWRTRDVTRLGDYRLLELRKMTKSDVKTFINKVFTQNEDDYITIALGKRLVKYINDNKLLVDTTTPLMVLLISWYWAETNGNKGIPERVGKLYDEILTLMHQNLTYAEIEKDTIIDQFGKLAVRGLTPTTTKIVFTEDEIKDICGEEGLEQALDMGFVCRKGEQGLQFFHKSGQEFCSGMYLANHPDELSLYLDCVETMKDALSIALVLTFACYGSKSAAKMIVGRLMELFKTENPQAISQYYAEKLPFEDMRPIQQFIGLCLECNFEADTKDEFASIMRDLFEDGKVVFIGIPPKTSISLAYYMAHCCSGAIRDMTLRPIAHASDPFSDFGPTGVVYKNALQSIRSLPSDKLAQIVKKFEIANPNLHKSFARYSDAQLSAYIQCIQACDGLPSASETNIVPVIESFKHINLEKLNVNNLKLGSNFDSILESLERDHLRSLTELSAKAVASSKQQIVRLATSLHKMPLLSVLHLSDNRAEPGQSVPILAKNLKFTSIQELFVANMRAPAEDMAVLTQNLPPQLKVLSMNGNTMNDAVVSNFVGNLPQSMTWLSINVQYLSLAIHNELLQRMHTTYSGLQRLYIWRSQHAPDLVKLVGLALPAWKKLHTLRLGSMSADPLPQDCVDIFLGGLHKARSMKTLWLFKIKVDKDGFERMVEICRENSVDTMKFNRASLPEGIHPEELDDFVILH